MSHGDPEATVARLLAMPDQAFTDVVMAECRGKAGDDITEALTSDLALCERWCEVLGDKTLGANDRLHDLEPDSDEYRKTAYFRNKVSKKWGKARRTRAELTNDAIIALATEMCGLLDDCREDGWVVDLSDENYETFERFILD